MSFFGVRKEFSDVNTPKTSISASGLGYPQNIVRAFILCVEGIRRSAERIKIKLFEPYFIFIRDFQKIRVGAPENQKIKKFWPNERIF